MVPPGVVVGQEAAAAAVLEPVEVELEEDDFVSFDDDVLDEESDEDEVEVEDAAGSLSFDDDVEDEEEPVRLSLR
ncbi:MAG TPA: hypothetical protein VKB57_02910 [Acidimicrobiales bacterium]|nr:hypothetical protein [Acidimicrobiales bacterium]